jgi:hypothetical protein
MMLPTCSRRLVAAMSVCLVGACAQKPTAPPPPTQPLARVAVLPIKMWPANGDAVSFNGVTSGASGVVFVPGNAAAVGPAVLGTGLSLLMAMPKRRLAEAVLEVRFDAQAAFEKRVWPALQSQQLPVVILDDTAVVNAFRAGDFKGVSADAMAKSFAGVDAVLDIQITSAGYYPADRAGGYSPMMYVVATLRPRDKPFEELARFNYDADYRPAEGETRFFTTPKEISADKPDTIRQKADLVREQMDAIAARMVERIVTDVGRRIRNESRLP